MAREKRFSERLTNPRKRWKFSDMDLASRTKWVEYSQAKDAMFEHTDTDHSPWFVVDADDKKAARLNCITHLLSQIDYHLMRHIILNVYIQSYLKKWFALFQIDSLLSSNKKVSSEPRAGD